MKVLFMGTPEFAVPSLIALKNARHEIVGVFTQPDKPKGRGYVLTPPPVKECAISYDIPVFQPKTLKNGEAAELISQLQPDVIAVVAYGKILPPEIIHFPKYGCINVHGSLLPKYRGAAPIQWAVINGEEKTGITTMVMDEGLDTGDILLKKETVISDEETSGMLHDRLSLIGANLLVQTLEGLFSGTITRKKQNNEESTYAPMIKKSLSTIDWNKSAKDVHNLVRGLQPWPVASTVYRGKVLKIHQTRVFEQQGGKPGEIMSVNPVVVGCADDTALELLEVQYEGKKRMKIQDFIRGNKIQTEMILGGAD